MILRIIITVALVAVILFISLFFWLKEKYMQINPDGTIKLEIPFLMDDQTPKD